MNHLGSWVSALVDGQLGAADAERALEHVAGCPGCAAAVAAEREARRRLAGADDVPAPPDLTSRLLALAAADEAPAPARRDPFAAPRTPAAAALWTAPWAAPWPVPPVASPDLVDHGRARRRRGRLLAGGVAAAVTVGGLFVVGDHPTVVPDPGPVAPLTRLAAATGPATASVVAAVEVEDPWAWVGEHGWVCPERVPEGWSVTDVKVHEDPVALEVDLSGPGGVVVVAEQPGRLDPALATTAIGGRDVVVLSESPWHGAWQSGDVVVEVVAPRLSAEVVEVVTAFPAAGHDDGVVARVLRGWERVLGAEPGH